MFDVHFFEECEISVVADVLLSCQEFYHKCPSQAHRPKIFGMTASLVDGGRGSNDVGYGFHELETNLNSTIVTVKNREAVERFAARASENLICYRDSNILECLPTSMR